MHKISGLFRIWVCLHVLIFFFFQTVITSIVLKFEDMLALGYVALAFGTRLHEMLKVFQCFRNPCNIHQPC